MKISEKITVKIFAGCLMPSDLRLHLSKSKEWQLISVIPLESREIRLQEVHFQGKDYLGYYLEDDLIQIKDLQEIKTAIQLFLKRFCPEYQAVDLKVYVIPQIFVA